MSYRDRVLKSIKFTSPEGDVFVANWAGDERVSSKNLGVFNYPGVNKPSVQDLGISGVEYPLTVSFSGDDNDLVSTAFFEALSQKGQWIVEHPTKGVKRLQPVSFTEAIQPIRSGDLTIFSTVWIDVVSDSDLVSAVRLSSIILEQNNVVDNSALNQLVDNADQTNTETVQAIRSSTEKNLAVYDSTIKELADTDPDVSAKSDSILRSIRATIAKAPIDLTVLGGQIQALISAPSVITGITLQTLKVYQDFIEGVISAPAEQISKTNLNITLINEMFLTSSVSTVNLISGQSEPATRSIAISNVEFVSDVFDTVTNALDEVQEQYTDLLIKDQYFSQSESFTDALTMSAQTISYLLSITFDLAIEKRFLLKEGLPPVIVCINEYGELGDNDSKLDFFIETNNLQGDQVLWLPVGFEVVVYV